MLPSRLLTLALAAAFAALAAGAAAQAGSGTTCYGGETDSQVVWVDLPAVSALAISTSPDPPRTYLAFRDGSLWLEANGQAGLQRTARLCYDQAWDDTGRIISSTEYVDYSADQLVVP